MGKVAIDFKTGSIKSKDAPVMGIDLGTSNSLIAYVKDGVPHVIKDNHSQKVLVPSVIYINQQSELLIGEEAKAMLEQEPDASIYSVKRLIGKSFQEIQSEKLLSNHQTKLDLNNQIVKLKIGHQYFTAIELSSFILKRLKKTAEEHLGTSIEKAVITVPAYFNDEQRQATRDAGKLAGLDVLRIVNEPTAAALAYGIGLDKDKTQNIAVYDLGGGTFDISILRIENGIFDVLSTNGNTQLGGDDIDESIVEFLQSKLDSTQYSSVPITKSIAEKLKSELSQLEIATTAVGNLQLSLSLNELNEIAEPLIQQTIQCCKNAVKDSGLSLQEIDEVILVGGSTRLQLVKQKVSEYFKKKPNDNLNPDEAVAIGAAIQADILAGNRKDFLLLDITPLSLGIETMGGLMDVIIPRNSKIPVQLARQYTTSKDAQQSLRITVYQGERDLVSYNRKLAEFILKNIPAFPAGIAKIEVQFLIDADGILRVKAKELRSGQESSIEIKSQFALDQNTVAKMLSESIQFAQSDAQTKAWVDAVNEAQYMIAHSNKFIQQNSTLLSAEELSVLQNFIEQLNQGIQSQNKEQLQHVIDQMNQSTQSIAHRIMDINIGKSLEGTTIDSN